VGNTVRKRVSFTKQKTPKKWCKRTKKVVQKNQKSGAKELKKWLGLNTMLFTLNCLD
jgi:hypothetical protein